MRKFCIRFFLHLKMYLKNPAFLVLVGLVLLCAFFFGRSSSQKTESFRIGVYREGDDSLSRDLTERLKDYDGIFVFEEFSDSDEMYRLVRKGTLAGAVTLTADIFDENLGILREESIISVHPLGSTVSGAVNEIVYAELIAIVGQNIITDYVDKSLVFAGSGTEYVDELLEKYNQYLENGSTFSLVVSTCGAGGAEEMSAGNLTVKFPFRGVVSIIIFMCPLIGLCEYLRNKESGVYTVQKKSDRQLFGLLHILVPTLVICVVSLIAFSVLGEYRGIIEIGAMLILFLMSVIWALFSGLFIRKSMFCIPYILIMVVAALIVCPVFINADRYFPIVRVLEKLFVPYYYLRLFM